MLITHEPDVAAQAKRVIGLSDGKIVEDRRSAAVHGAPRPAGAAEVSPPRNTDAAAAEAQPVIGVETLRIAWGGIHRQQAALRP